MKFSVAATSIISAGSAAIVAAENGTRRRERVQDKDDLMKGHQESGEETSKAASLADIDVEYKKFIGNSGVRAGPKKQRDLGAADLGVLHQGRRGRKMRQEGAMSMPSETGAGIEGRTRPAKFEGRTRPLMSSDKPEGVGELSVDAAVLKGLGKVGLDVEEACEDLYPTCAEVPSGVSGGCNSYFAQYYGGQIQCNGKSTGCYCAFGVCCNPLGARCTSDSDCCYYFFGDECIGGYCANDYD